VPADGIHYWASNTHGDVTPLNHISFSDVDAGCSPVTVTFTSDNCGDALDATNLCGSGVSVLCGNDSSQIKLEGSISDINTYLFNGNLLWNPDGSPNHASAELTVQIDDNGTAPGGNVVSSTVDISEICNPDFCGSSVQDFSNVNFTDICTVYAGSGCDTITTSWNHQGAATVYDGGGGDDTVHLLFTPDQLAEIVADQCTQDALLSYIQGPCGQTLNLSGTSWNAEAQNFEHADINLVTGYGSGTLSSVNTLISQPDFIVGTSGNDCNLSGAGCGNHVIVGLDGNDTLTGGAGNDGLIGGAGNDILVGGPGNDVLSGGAGNDTFRFTETSCGHANFGNDIVVDYHPGEDSIEIGQDIFANLAALRAATTDDCHGNAVITVDCNNSITLSGVSTADVIAHQSDFHLVA
jgi:Ca2+-binding RTX toxin-like protein